MSIGPNPTHPKDEYVCPVRRRAPDRTVLHESPQPVTHPALHGRSTTRPHRTTRRPSHHRHPRRELHRSGAPGKGRLKTQDKRRNSAPQGSLVTDINRISRPLADHSPLSIRIRTSPNDTTERHLIGGRRSGAFERRESAANHVLEYRVSALMIALQGVRSAFLWG